MGSLDMVMDSISQSSSHHHRLQVETLEMFASRISKNVRKSPQSWEKEICFVFLQLINALKYLQAQGIEDISVSSLDYFLLVRDDKDPHYRIVMVENHIRQSQKSQITSLCSIGLAAMLLLFKCENPIKRILSPLDDNDKIELPELTPSVGMFSIMCELLQHRSSMALGQVKSMLEYMLWGPNDIAFEWHPLVARCSLYYKLEQPSPLQAQDQRI